jgi:hypothetical protein
MKPPKQSDMFALEHSDLNEFLFAIVGTELNGMALTVLSLFARIDGDPWREAGRLASMPKTAASASLAQIIAGMPMTVWSLSDATAIAARLVCLLPSRSSASASTEIQSRQRWAGRGRISYRAAVVPLLCIALGVAFAFAAFVHLAVPAVVGLR